MCNPTFYMNAGTTNTAGGSTMMSGSVVSAVGQLYAGYAARKSADAQAQMAADQAEQFRQEGLDRASAIRRAAVAVRGSAASAYASSGVRLGEGSPGVVDQQIIADSESDAAAAILTGRRRGSAGDMEAAGLKRAGRDAQVASLINAGSTLLGSGAQYDRWSRKQRQAQIDAGEVY